LLLKIIPRDATMQKFNKERVTHRFLFFMSFLVLQVNGAGKKIKEIFYNIGSTWRLLR
jgi:hypothetical protein